MCFSYCVTVLSPAFLELFLESCLPRICLISQFCWSTGTWGSLAAFPVVSGLPPASAAADLNLLLLFRHSCYRKRVRARGLQPLGI